MDEELLYRLIGEKIRATREKSQPRLSQQKLADKLGISRVSIVNIEGGRQRTPLHVLWRIAEALSTEITQLLPRHSELLESGAPIKLDIDAVKVIEEAANGDLETKRLLSQFVSKAKSRQQ